MQNKNSDNSIPNYKEIGARLKEIRGTLSQAEFGKTLGYSYSYARDCEHGKKQSIEYLFKVATVYNVPIEWILKGVLTPINAKECTPIDYDLNRMISILTDLLQSSNKNLRGWAIVQFENAYKEQCAEYDRKNFISKHADIPALAAEKSQAKYGN